jgi:hypothetical protein
MNFHYDLNSASRMYREEALREARKRHLAEQGGGNRWPLLSRLGNVGSLLSGVAGALKG